MAQTLVALFEDMPAAMRARRRLVATGFAERDVDVHTTEADRDAAAQLEATSSARFDPWLRTLLGMNAHDAYDRDVWLHRQALERGAVMLSLAAETAAQAERAIDLLQACGPMDLDAGSVRSAPSAALAVDRRTNAAPGDVPGDAGPAPPAQPPGQAPY